MSESFVVSDGWMDFCVVIWVVMDEAIFDRDFDVDGQSAEVGAIFAALISGG